MDVEGKVMIPPIISPVRRPPPGHRCGLNGPSLSGPNQQTARTALGSAAHLDVVYEGLKSVSHIRHGLGDRKSTARHDGVSGKFRESFHKQATQ